jgi:hypothetical protein
MFVNTTWWYSDYLKNTFMPAPSYDFTNIFPCHYHSQNRKNCWLLFFMKN